MAHQEALWEVIGPVVARVGATPSRARANVIRDNHRLWSLSVTEIPPIPKI